MLKNKSTIIAILVIAIGVSGYYFYQYKEKEKECLKKIEYHSSSAFNPDGDPYYSLKSGGSSGGINRFPNIKQFKTQEEAMEYCMKVL